jgi:hypothetical protein
MKTAVCYLHADCRELPELGAECARSQTRPAATKWRESWLPAMRLARWLERVALESGLPFEVRPDWFPPAIDWAEFEQPMSSFEERVRLAAERFGPPKEVTTATRVYLGKAPDLIATWELKPPPWERRMLQIQVRTLHPVGIAAARGAVPKTDTKFEPIKLRVADAAALAKLAKSVRASESNGETKTGGNG